MATELENRFIIGEEECQYVVDTAPQKGSTAFITSGAVFDWYQSMQPFMGRSVVNEGSDFRSDNTNIPTVGLVYTKLKALEDRVAALENS